jgi:hypothetical protein
LALALKETIKMFSKEEIVQRIELMDQIITIIRNLRASEMAELEEIEAKTFENLCDDSTGSRSPGR